jgi:hypothetical protein
MIGRLSASGGRFRVAVTDSLINDPRHWRNRASEARVLAETVSDPKAKLAMIEYSSPLRLDRRARARARVGTRAMTRKAFDWGP